MTDTDDTDELLLIPPDFFVVESDSGQHDPVRPYYNIVDKLIKQVDGLQHRLKTIEVSESFLSHSMDFTQSPSNMNSHRQNFRKYNSTDDLQTSYSAQNTPQKPSSKFKLNSLPNSPNVDRLQHPRSFRRGLGGRLVEDSPEGKYTRFDRDGQTLNEIDTFLSKVKSIQRISAVRNLENDFNTFGSVKSGERSQNSGNLREEPSCMKKTWQCGDNKDSVPDYGTGMRDLLYNDKLKENKLYSNNTHSNYPLNDSIQSAEKNFTDSSSDSTLITAYGRSKPSKTNLLTNPIHSNAVNILNMHKKLVEDSSHKISSNDIYKEHKRKARGTIVGDNFGAELGLMNLADIWNANAYDSLTASQFTQKLQEEKYRRQHCENLIQELQTRNLEMQQKLSVAVKVDDAKNKTIQQFQDTMEKLIVRLEKLNKEKVDYEFEINKLQNRHIDEKEEADQRIGHYEKEASKALNLAHANQEKSNMLESKCKQLENENQTLKRKLDVSEENYVKECDKYKQMSEILAQKEIEINENKITLSSASAEITQSRKAVEGCQKEFNKMKEEYIKMDDKLKEERTQTVKLNKEVMDLLEELDSRKKREIELQDEITKLKKHLESNKVELRNFYQGQVEILVQNKLKEFQCQLDQTENNFKDEIKKREMAIAKSAASHIQQISEKSTLEIKLLEKKHQEEIKLYQIQIMQHKQQAESIQSKLIQFQEKRVTVAKQLQKVMESQWNEAMRIIANGKSPTFHEEPTTFSTIDQLNNLRTKSYTNLEEVLSQHDEEDNYNNMVGRKTLEQEEPCSMLGSNTGKITFDRFGQQTETPVSSKATQLARPALSETDIQKYISLFLNKPTGNQGIPSQEDLLKELESYCFDANSRDKDDGSRTSRGQQRDRKGSKPPWK